MLEAELFAFLERTSDAAFTVTEQGEILFVEPIGRKDLWLPGIGSNQPHLPRIPGRHRGFRDASLHFECSVQRCACHG